MKKKTLFLILLVWILTLTACGRMATPIVLPKAENILSVDVTFGEVCTNHLDRAWIEAVIDGISRAKPTSKASIQDTPQAEVYRKIDFHFEQGTSTLFVYQKGAKYYAEQPYQGIYELDQAVYEQILAPAGNQYI